MKRNSALLPGPVIVIPLLISPEWRTALACKKIPFYRTFRYKPYRTKRTQKQKLERTKEHKRLHYHHIENKKDDRLTSSFQMNNNNTNSNRINREIELSCRLFLRYHYPQAVHILSARAFRKHCVVVGTVAGKTKRAVFDFNDYVDSDSD